MFRLIAAVLALVTAAISGPSLAQSYNRTIGDIRDDGPAGREEWERALGRCRKAMPLELEEAAAGPNPHPLFLDCMYSQGWKVVTPPMPPKPAPFEGPYGWRGPSKQRNFYSDQKTCSQQNPTNSSDFAACMRDVGWTYTPWPIPEVRRPKE